MSDLAARLAPAGILRAAINTANRALVEVRDGRLGGVSPALAARLAGELGAVLEPVVYDGAGKVVADAGEGRWSIAFLAVDPARMDRLAFTRPYLTIETTFAVRPGGPATVGEVDAPGRTIVSSVGSAYDLHLANTIRHAAIVRAPTPAEAMARFAAGEGDAVAGVRASLAARFAAAPDVAILEGTLASVGQAIAVPIALADTLEDLDAFLVRAIERGGLAQADGG